MLWVFSIGLNVKGAEPSDQYARTLGAIVAYLPGARRIAETVGAWDGVMERTLHVLADMDWAYPFPPTRSAAGLAHMLRQDAVACIAYDARPGECWKLVTADGAVSIGGSVEEFPIIVHAGGIKL